MVVSNWDLTRGIPMIPPLLQMSFARLSRIALDTHIFTILNTRLAEGTMGTGVRSAAARNHAGWDLYAKFGVINAGRGAYTYSLV